MYIVVPPGTREARDSRDRVGWRIGTRRSQGPLYNF